MQRALSEAESSYLELVETCDTAISSCGEAAEVCAFKATEAHRNKRVTHIIGNVASAVIGGVGLVVLVATGTTVTGGIGAVVGAGTVCVVGGAGFWATHYIASDYTKGEASFRNIRRECKCLMTFACDLKEGVAKVRTNLESVSMQINHIANCITNECSFILLQDVLKRLNMVCTDSYTTTSKCKREVNTKLQELKIMDV